MFGSVPVPVAVLADVPPVEFPPVDVPNDELPKDELPNVPLPLPGPVVEPLAVAPFVPFCAGLAGFTSESVNWPPGPTWIRRHSSLPVIGSL